MAIACSASIRLGSARIQNHRLRSASWRRARSTTCAMFLLLSACLEGRTAPPSTSRHPTSDCSPFRPKTAHDLLGSTDGRLNRDAILRPDGHQLMSIPTFERGEGGYEPPLSQTDRKSLFTTKAAGRGIGPGSGVLHEPESSLCGRASASSNAVAWPTVLPPAVVATHV